MDNGGFPAQSLAVPIDATLHPAYAAARDICRHHAKSFFFASRFLPRDKRLHAFAVYAFCRLLDDAVDEADSPESQQAGLSRFEKLLADCYAREGPFDEPSLTAFAATIRSCSIPKHYFDDLVEGCRMDLTPARYETWRELEKYCYHVAGVVGLIMCRVFDLRDDSVLDRAVMMGNAMQLTNILRDVGEDFSRGRIYLPREDLSRFGVDETIIASRQISPGFVDLMQFEVARARQLYADASQGLVALPPDGSRQTACVMAVVYAGILGAIERNRFDTLKKRARLSTTQKLLRVPKALRLSKRGDSTSIRLAYR